MSVSPRTRAPPPGAQQDLAASGLTIPSDSENYDANNESSSSSNNGPPLSSSSAASSPLILYQPPTVWGLLRGAAINLLLPFVNGLMLGFGELFANEVAWRWGWGGTKVFPHWRSGTRRVGPGVEMRRNDPVTRRRKDGEEMDMYTSLE